MSSTALNPALQAHFTSDAAPRPILTSLNGDNSWLISFPRPAAERARHGNKAYFHVVSDAWLTRDTVLFSPWILNLRNQAEAAIPDGPAVERLIREIETAAGAANLGSGAPAAEPQPSPVDAIFQNFHYSDHLDEHTLRTFDPDTPVFATAEATAVIWPWHHFRHLATTRDLDPAKPEWLDLRPEGDAQLPEWLSIFRLVGHHPLNFATAIVYSSDSAAPDASDGNSPPNSLRQDTQHEALLYSPHGIRADQPSLHAFAQKLDPPVRVLALLHALKDSFAFGLRTTLGVAGGLALERQVRPKYWVKSHDAGLVYSGIVAWVAWINDITRSLEDGLAEEKAKAGNYDEVMKPNYIEVENGDSFVLA